MFKFIFYIVISISLISCEKPESKVCGEVISKPDPIRNTYDGSLQYFLLVKLSNELNAWIIVNQTQYDETIVGNYVCGQPNH